MDRSMEMARRVADKVREAGGRTFYVGGYVRDRLLGIDNKDIDIEVHGVTPAGLEAILDSLGERLTMGASFGIYGLRHVELDIAMPRKETATGRGHRDFDVLVDPFIGTEKAAMRRDFTMNALMQDVLTGEVVDHFGGVADLRAGVLRHVNDDTFGEDPLRVLRGAQFAARFGFSVHPDTMDIFRRMDLRPLARERVLGEMEKALIKAPAPSAFFQVLREAEQLAAWFPELGQLNGETWNKAFSVIDRAAELRAGSTWPMGLMMAALCVCLDDRAGQSLTEAERFLNRLTGETKLIRQTENALRLLPELEALLRRDPENAGCTTGGPDTTEEAVLLLDRAENAENLALLAEADDNDPGQSEDRPDAKRDLLARWLSELKRRTQNPQVTGADLTAAGFRPGPAFRDALALGHRLALMDVPKDEAIGQVIASLTGHGV